MEPDPTTETLPQPPREAYDQPVYTEAGQEYPTTPEDTLVTPEAPQNARPTASDSPAKLGITAVRQLDERVGVMLDRINAFRVFAAKYGVDQNTISPSLIKRELVAALTQMETAESYLNEVKHHTQQARETLESL